MLLSRLKTLLAVWGLAEVIAFALVVHFAGLGWTLLALVATTALGFALLKRTGAATMLMLRATFQGHGPQSRRRDGAVVGNALAVLGALLLALPGFLSDVAGLALLLPPVRRRLAASLGGGRMARLFAAMGGRVEVRGRDAGGPTVDLDPGEWRSRDPATRKLPS